MSYRVDREKNLAMMLKQYCRCFLGQ